MTFVQTVTIMVRVCCSYFCPDRDHNGEVLLYIVTFVQTVTIMVRFCCSYFCPDRDHNGKVLL